MNVLRNRLGFALRETGQALERLGCRFQGINSFEEESEQQHCCLRDTRTQTHRESLLTPNSS